MRNVINSDKQNQCFETCRSYESAEEEKGKSPHFITKVTDVKWNIDGASYAVCHYNGNLPTHEGWDTVRSKLAYFITLYINQT